MTKENLPFDLFFLMLPNTRTRGQLFLNNVFHPNKRIYLFRNHLVIFCHCYMFLIIIFIWGFCSLITLGWRAKETRCAFKWRFCQGSDKQWPNSKSLEDRWFFLTELIMISESLVLLPVHPCIRRGWTGNICGAI